MMKKYLIYIFALLFCLSQSIFSQKKATHEKTTYTDEDGRFYINKELPVYLRLSDSPDENAKSYLLNSEVTKKFSNPLYLPKEGFNIIKSPWCVDPETRKTIHPNQYVIFEVYADSKPPVTIPKYKNSKKYVKRDKVYYSGNLSIELNSYDKVSGIKTIYLSKNGADYSETNGVVTFSNEEETEYKLKFYAVDNVGNAAKEKDAKFTIDRNAPTTRYILRGVQDGENVISWDSYILLKSKDDLSGVNSMYYAFDGGKPQLYRDKITLGHLDGGEHTLDFYAIDNVGNSNQKKETDEMDANTVNFFNFILDKKGPQTELKLDGDEYIGKYHFVSPRTKFTIKSADKESGTAYIYYGINKNAKSKTFEKPFQLPDKKGFHKISYTAMDNVKNMAGTRSKSFYVDNEPPVTRIRYNYPKFFNRDTLFITEKTKISLSGIDNESGVQKTEYSIDGDEYKSFDEAFTLSEKGYHSIKFKTTDKVNNIEQIKESEIVVDNTSPEIYVNFNVKAIRSEDFEGEKLKVYPTYTRLYIGATDRYSGTETILYSINDQPAKKYTSVNSIADKSQLTKEGVYAVKITAKDKLGNKSEKIVRFLIKRK